MCWRDKLKATRNQQEGHHPLLLSSNIDLKPGKGCPLPPPGAPPPGAAAALGWVLAQFTPEQGYIHMQVSACVLVAGTRTATDIADPATREIKAAFAFSSGSC